MSPHVDSASERPEPERARGRSFFARKGVFVRDPGGGSGGKGPVEDAAGLEAAGFRWVAFNVGEHPLDSYDTWVDQAMGHGLAFGPWARCHDAADVRRLAEQAVTYGCDFVIVNLEQEPARPRWRVSAREVAAVLLETELPLAVSTEPWLPDNLDWAYLNSCGFSCLPQAFWNEDPRWTPAMVCVRAGRWFRNVYPTLGVYPSAGRELPAAHLATFYAAAWGVGNPYSLYTSDDVPTWLDWRW